MYYRVILLSTLFIVNGLYSLDKKVVSKRAKRYNKLPEEEKEILHVFLLRSFLHGKYYFGIGTDIVNGEKRIIGKVGIDQKEVFNEPDENIFSDKELNHRCNVLKKMSKEDIKLLKTMTLRDFILGEYSPLPGSKNELEGTVLKKFDK